VITRKLGPLVNITGLLVSEPSLEVARDTEITGPFQLALLNTVPKKPALQDNDWNTPTIRIKGGKMSDTFEANFRDLSVHEPSSQAAGDTKKGIWQPGASQAASSDTAPKKAKYRDDDWNTPTIQIRK
jgi:hypothetical protein